MLRFGERTEADDVRPATSFRHKLKHSTASLNEMWRMQVEDKAPSISPPGEPRLSGARDN